MPTSARTPVMSAPVRARCFGVGVDGVGVVDGVGTAEGVGVTDGASVGGFAALGTGCRRVAGVSCL